ncbi:MAG: DUF927 domain-containing protein [Bacteroides sp.]|nr:DUF927 domain-containing protein [Eubacterium sp.]MCM1419678.1 DUF927 domain-containing protein [Roseburia sp.]MCM1463667.1 DUF927 domain-containing protein [Bacteroides sp.]
MNREEAEKFGESPEVTEGLLALFQKNIDEYTREDFIDGTEPYDYLLLYKDDLFTLERKRQKLEAVARKNGVKNFSKIFKEYCAARGQEVGNLNVTAFPEQPLALRCGNYLCDGRGVHLEAETVCSHPILPVARLVNIDTGLEKIKVAFRREKGWRTAIFDRKTISTANKITDLSDLGIAVTSESAKGLVKYFSKLEELNGDLIPEIECVSRLGWIGDGDELRFSPYVDSLVFDGEGDFRKAFESIGCRGDFGKWCDLIDENVRHGHIISRVVFAASLASVLIKPLGGLPFFIHLWGESGNGKTVLASCAASVWANPELGSYIQSVSGTFVGKERYASFFNNLPFFMDEAQIVKDRKGCDSEIYMLTEGVGKMRGSKTGGVSVTPTWKNSIIMTGEEPILTANSGGGASNRVIEVECKSPLFRDPKAVLRGVMSNYGFFGKVFILKLTKEGFDHPKKLYDDFYRELTDEYGITQKQALSAALVLTADQLATEWLFADTPSLTPAEIADFLKTKTEVSLNPRAYEYVCEFVASNQNKFMGSSEYSEVWGIMDGDSVYILKNKFNQICDEGGYSAQSLLSWLSDRRLIRRTDKKNYSVLKRIGSSVVRCIHMTINDSPEESFDEIEL